MNNLQEINLGSAPNAEDGDDARTGGFKINEAIKVLNQEVPVWKSGQSLTVSEAPHYRVYGGKMYVYVGNLPEVTLSADVPGQTSVWSLLGDYIDEKVSKGLKPAQPISLTANQPHEYTLPQDANLYSIRISGAATVKIGTTSGGNEINEYSPATSVIWTLGFRNELSVFFTSDTDITITPMIFQW
ncbi:hypothetical protein MHM83_10890 [Tenacibaculum sp. Mcav3-52]|uniref:hypothetical protein n=1 Tax=Tenacibaculum sp. Mcav3-52 TaxID=2917762 RepID=UPI001EF37BDC|nr:hypothetical protein [Tenacibaculum sp. Mcav3-52]MCG7502378.1 hypothetical protein [Tenacibaculum sp. Mcav3-52]